ncbi:hypothetical protein [Acinetobacter ursingii]|uniref:hypothetical protein n=1 Tax=Acinetobacter ursingii TaxID=108980 RepID=UPI0021D140F7|nr:hypothetical protein [Acinetobacter ursingii]MCU4359309.1 hypothetical protein [Acinetobacter ursingii]
MDIKFERWAYYIILISIISTIIFGTTYLPMTDLPQHAGQVVALDDLLKGQSSWAHLIEFNIFTPYLIGYALWLSVYQFVDIVTASKIIIAFTFFLYVFSFYKLRKYYQAEKITDWVVLPSFFGFAYYYGFVTFLIGIPVGILFFLQMKKWFDQGGNANFLLSCLFGVVLFFSHVLSFLFFILLSFVILIYQHRVQSYRFFIPFFIFGLLVVAYLLKGDSLGSQYDYGGNRWTPFLDKLKELFINTWTLHSNVSYVYIILSFLLLILPFLSGFRLSKNVERYIPVCVFLVCWFSLPLLFNNIYFIYNRYTLLFFGFYYLIFDKSNDSHIKLNFLPLIYVFVLILVFKVLLNIFNFNKESKDFLEFVNELPERKSVASLMFEKSPILTESAYTFVQFPLWYQAQKHGWVDYNFAWASPQLIRFKPDQTPEMGPGTEWAHEAFLQVKNCEHYDLVIARIRDLDYLQAFMNSANCGHNYKMLLQHSYWVAYQRIS